MTSPVALAVEDLHWADPAFILLLRRLGKVVGQRPLLLRGAEIENRLPAGRSLTPRRQLDGQAQLGVAAQQTGRLRERVS